MCRSKLTQIGKVLSSNLWVYFSRSAPNQFSQGFNCFNRSSTGHTITKPSHKRQKRKELSHAYLAVARLRTPLTVSPVARHQSSAGWPPPELTTSLAQTTTVGQIRDTDTDGILWRVPGVIDPMSTWTRKVCSSVLTFPHPVVAGNERVMNSSNQFRRD